MRKYVYGDGEGIERDVAEAIRWHEHAAAKGYEGANSNLGRLRNSPRGALAETSSWPLKSGFMGQLDINKKLAEFNIEYCPRVAENLHPGKDT